MHSRIHLLKLGTKFICCLFTQTQLTNHPIALGIFTSYFLILLINRYYYTRIYWAPYRRWVLFTEFSLFWLSLWNLLQKTTHLTIDIYDFTILVIGGLFPFCLFMGFTFTKWKYERLFLKEMQGVKGMGSEV